MSSCRTIPKSDVVTPHPALPERRLWTQVLYRAILDAIRNNRDARRWFRCNQFYVGSFLWITDSLDLHETRNEIKTFAMTTKARSLDSRAMRALLNRVS